MKRLISLIFIKILSIIYLLNIICSTQVAYAQTDGSTLLC